MKDQILYVELKSGYHDNGPAWIGKGSRSKSGRTIYFDGKAFHALSGTGIQGNYRDIETGDEYWISGVKKNQEDRHWAGSGPVMIDDSVVKEYLAFTGLNSLNPKRFEIVQLDHSDVVNRIHELENRTLEQMRAGMHWLYADALDSSDKSSRTEARRVPGRRGRK
jgi:hypothetical protein